MNKDKNELITLKEAAELTGYSSDYIGQLIRSGKLSGKQVFTNVAWMTTREAVFDYAQRDKKNMSSHSTQKKNYAEYFHSPDFFVKLYTYSGWTVVVVLLLFVLLFAYIFSVSIDHRINANYLQTIEYAR